MPKEHQRCTKIIDMLTAHLGEDGVLQLKKDLRARIKSGIFSKYNNRGNTLKQKQIDDMLKLQKQNPKMTFREIARRVGVSEMTVAKYCNKVDSRSKLRDKSIINNVLTLRKLYPRASIRTIALECSYDVSRATVCRILKIYGN